MNVQSFDPASDIATGLMSVDFPCCRIEPQDRVLALPPDELCQVWKELKDQSTLEYFLEGSLFPTHLHLCVKKEPVEFILDNWSPLWQVLSGSLWRKYRAQSHDIW